jgi:Ca-activated chloride channel homolog
LGQSFSTGSQVHSKNIFAIMIGGFPMSETKYPWPEWALTAYVLNEVKPELAEQIRKAEADDNELAAEIAALRGTLDQVSALYKNETQNIASTQFDPTQVSAASAVAALGAERSIDQGFAMGKWIGLASLAASMLAAAYFVRPDFFHGGSKSEMPLAVSTSEQRNESLRDEHETLKSEPTDDSPPPSLPEMASVETSGAVANRASESVPMRKQIESDDAAVEMVSGPENRKEASDSPMPDSAERLTKQVQGDSGMRSSTSSKSLEKSESMESKASLANIPEKFGENVRSRNLETNDAEKKAALSTNPASNPAPGVEGMGMGGMGPAPGVGNMGGMESMGMGGGGRRNQVRTAKSQSAAPAASQLGDAYDSLDIGRQAGGADGYVSESLESEEGLAHDFKLGLSRGLGEDRRKYHAPRPGLGYEGSTDRYQAVPENEFSPVNEQPLSTFSIDVDSASYVKTRQFLLQSNRLPPPAAVRIEDFVNYFDYEYAGPQGVDPFAANLAVANCPWQPSHKLVRIALQATKVDVRNRPKANIVFLLDVSGSMDQPNKLPLVKESMRMLIQQLGENDRVAMVVYAGAAGCVLESTRGDQQELILGALDRLNAGGSTNGGQGIQLAYDLARDHFVPGGINRVILCTDGDFNVGVTSTDSLVNLVAQNAKSKIFLTVLGFGMGNTNDAMMEQISNKGNGLYGFVDSHREARRQMVQQLAGNLMTVAKDVKIQVEFNPQHVASYRLIGYENRKLENRDFADDKKDAGEIGAGHRVTALYEIVPVNANERLGQAGENELRYGKKKADPVAAPGPADDTPLSRELLTVKLRYKQPEGDTSKLLTFPLLNQNVEFSNADRDFQWAASMAQFGMLLRNSRFKGDATWSSLTRMVDNAAGVNPDANRQECIDMIRNAASFSLR